MILLLKTNESSAYVGISDDGKIVAERQWEAGRKLSNDLLSVITSICKKVANSTSDFDGIVVFEGPGSYTGLRIGISVANSLGYSYDIPVTGSAGEAWQTDGLRVLQSLPSVEKKFKPITPVYGSAAHVTKPRK